MKTIVNYSTPDVLFIKRIKKEVSKQQSVPLEEIDNKTRKREVVQARQIAMYFSKKYTKCSLATIGSYIGGKDHATVLHACKAVENLIETDKQVAKDINEINEALKNTAPNKFDMVCGICGRTNIQKKIWVNMSKLQPIEDVSKNVIADQYCLDCNAHVSFMLFDDYLKIIDAVKIHEEEVLVRIASKARKKRRYAEYMFNLKNEFS